MDSAYNYLLTVAEGLLKESELPAMIINKYFALKSLTLRPESMNLVDRSVKD